MGYVHDTDLSQFIPPSDIELSAGTWAVSDGSNKVIRARSAADAAFTAYIPVRIPIVAPQYKGCKLQNVKIWYAIGTKAADDFATVELLKMKLGADDVAIIATAPAITLDAGHDSAAERKAIDDDHCMTITVDNPVWADENDIYWVKLVIDCADTTVFTFVAARANFTLRI